MTFFLQYPIFEPPDILHFTLHIYLSIWISLKLFKQSEQLKFNQKAIHTREPKGLSSVCVIMPNTILVELKIVHKGQYKIEQGSLILKISTLYNQSN